MILIPKDLLNNNDTLIMILLFVKIMIKIK